MGLFQIKISLSLLLLLQLLYCFLGIGFNGVSYLRTRFGARQLSSNPPIVGAIFLLIYGMFLVAGYNDYYQAYRVLMVLALFFFGYFGIIRHFILYARTPESYSSKLSWFVAISINLFGFLLNLIAAAGRFTAVIK